MILASPQQPGFVPRRIVSLVPSQTELLHYLGLEEETVGITRFCIHPKKWFRSKTRVGGTKDIHPEIITRLQPDLIIANKEENEKLQVEALARDFPVWVTDVNDLPGALQMITDIGVLTGRVEQANLLVEQITGEFDKINILPASHPKAKLAYLIWKEPLMAAGGGTFINDMLQRCGFENVLGQNKRYPETSVGELLAAGCKTLLLSSEPYPFGPKHIAYFRELLPGVNTELVDGEYFSWYGSRLLGALAYFNSLINKLLKAK